MLPLLLPYCCQAPTAAPGPFLWRVSCSSMAIRRADERTRTADLISLRVRFGLLYLRACADRSWPARRSALPAVAAPSFPDEPTHDDDHLGESYPEVDHLPTPLGTPHEHYFAQRGHRPDLDPLVAPIPQRGGRTQLIGDPMVGTAEHQYLNQLLKYHSVGYARAVAAERMVDLSFG